MGILFLLLQYSNTSYGKKYIFIDLTIASLIGNFIIYTGGYTVVSIKALSSILKMDFYRMFTHWITYFMLMILILTGILQIKFLNKSLSSFNSVEVIPTNFVLFTTCSIISSSIMYHDLARTSPIALVGVMCMFLGVILITSKENSYSSLDVVEPEQSAEWETYNQWNNNNQDLWNPPQSWGSASPKLDATSPLLVPISTSFGTSKVSNTPPNMRQSRPESNRPNSISSRLPIRSSFDGEDGNASLRRLSFVLDSVGTHHVRRLEFDHINGSICGKSPSR
jgi:hypothetical protein